MTPKGSPTVVLVHGAGNTSLIWRAVQDHLRHASIAVDLPGRRDRPGDITRITIDQAAASAAKDVVAASEGGVVLVGHSAGGIVLPALTARLDGRVEQLVFVAGLSAPDGAAVVETVRPGYAVTMAARLEELRESYRDHMLEADGLHGTASTVDDVKAAMAIESLNFMTQTVSWKGVPPTLERTFVRCLRDAIQPREMQARLAANCGASTVIDIDSGHTPAVSAPVELAAILDRIADRSAS
jgi:pimeloyl-ACP methyl ester carboxylesterase